MADTDIAITGFQEAQAALRSFSTTLARKITKAALRQGANVVKKHAKQIAPKDKGIFARSIVVRDRKTRPPNIKMVVAYSSTPYAGLKKGNYSSFVENGHVTGKRLPKGSIGRRADAVEEYRRRKVAKGGTIVPGAHTLQKAYDATKFKAVDKFSETIAKLIAQELGDSFKRKAG